MFQRLAMLMIVMLLLTAHLVSGRTQAASSTTDDNPLSPQPFMVADLNQIPTSSNLGPFVVIEDVVYYFTVKGHDYEHVELWRSDGSEAGTHLVKDLHPGHSGSSPSMLTAIDNTIYFLASGGLWRSDGTEAGTTILFNKGSVHALTVLNETLYFFHTSYEAASYKALELWRSDGTEAGTTLIKEVNNYSLGVGNPSDRMVVFDNILYFSAEDREHGIELWRSDGTAAGTTLLKDIRPGDQSSEPAGFIEAGGFLYFAAYQESGDIATELWRTDGTADGTLLVKNIATTAGESSYPIGLAEVQGKLLFTADDEIHGRELWISDGTAAGTTLLKDIVPGQADGALDHAYPFWDTRPVKLNETLYFLAYDGEDGFALWRTDATESGTYLLKHFVEPIYGLTATGDTFYFQADDGTHGAELWKSDGTAEGTALWVDIAPGPASSYPSSLTPFNDGLIFVANDGIHGHELWWSNGPADTRLVRDHSPGTESSEPYPIIPFNNQLIFSANHDGSFYDDDGLWQTDGTNTPTPFPDLGIGNETSYPLFVYNHELFMFNDRKYWRSDGTAAGTHFFVDMETLPDVPPALDVGLYFTMAIGKPTVFKELLYFPVFFGADADVAIHWEFVGLYHSDGVEIHRLDVDFTNVNWLATDGRSLYMSATTPETGTELWRSDGTKEGTSLVKDIDSSTAAGFPGSSSPQQPLIFNDILYFIAYPVTGTEVWRSDGTEKGTQILKDISPLSSGEGPLVLGNTEQFLFFSYQRLDTSEGLWRSDGTAAGTIELKRFPPLDEPGQNHILDMIGLGDILFFVVDDGEHGAELWFSDGTVDGTKLVVDIFPGNNGSEPQHLTPSRHGVLYFTADDGVHGRELWQSDGTAAGTRLTADIQPGPLGSDPQALTDVTLPGKSMSLFFSADDGEHGRELWTLPYITFTNWAYLPLTNGKP